MSAQAPDLARRLTAEALGTCFLVAAVVGSGIMGEQLAQGNGAVALLANAIATGAILVVLILIFGPVSGAHFNPAVSLAFLLSGELKTREFALYVPVQVAAGLAGTLIAHAMFDLQLVQPGTHMRSGFGPWLGEAVATLALLMAIFGCVRRAPQAVPYAVGLVITAGYWYTSSTSFANPAVTIARTMTDTFSSIRPVDAPAFVAVQLLGTVAAVLLAGWLYGRPGRA